MAYIQLTIASNEYQQEELISLLDDYNPTGFEQRENELIAYFNETEFDEKAIENIIHGYPYLQSRVEQKNWNEEWEKNFQPVVVENFCAVRADFHQSIEGVEHEIIITPKMSFGTGHHATTYMMIQQMKDLDFKGKKVFDFGTGTGILAILADKLGSESVSAIDVDEWSIQNAEENIRRNDCSHICLKLSSVIPEKQYDIVLANINRNVILQYLNQLNTSVVINGLLLLSGILAADKQVITDAFTKVGFIERKTLSKDNWLSLLFVKG
ncbi:MAG: 50S ribosomal protein L11 methyltransferase [Candidatus Dadabacteria bacterium]